jgi:hypothetical protein
MASVSDNCKLMQFLNVAEVKPKAEFYKKQIQYLGIIYDEETEQNSP